MQKYTTVTTKIYNNRTYHTSRRNSIVCFKDYYMPYSIITEKINTKNLKFYAKYAF